MLINMSVANRVGTEMDLVCVCLFSLQTASVLVHKNRFTEHSDMRLQLPGASLIGFVEHGVVSLGTVFFLCEVLGTLGLNSHFSDQVT